jgi:hypothetical protein
MRRCAGLGFRFAFWFRWSGNVEFLFQTKGGLEIENQSF